MWAVSTQPARSLAGAMRHACARHAWTFVDNVDNVPISFFLRLKRGVVSIRGYSYHYLQLPYNFQVINKVL